MTPSQSAAGDMPAVNFFGNYNRIVGAAYSAIVILLLAFFAFQINQKRNDELAVISGHVDRHSQLVEFILRSSQDYLEVMRTSAAAYYRSTPDPKISVANHTQGSRLFKQLKETNLGFNLDAVVDRDETGNLVGRGLLTGRSSTFYRDIEMALDLNLVFQKIAFNLPNATEAQFISVDHFTNTYPWADSVQRPFDTSS